MDRREKTALTDITYVKLVSVGSVNPNNPLSEQSIEQEGQVLNRCVNEYPKGIIVGKDVTIGRYMIGEHEVRMAKCTYNIGIKRKPAWEADSK